MSGTRGGVGTVGFVCSNFTTMDESTSSKVTEKRNPYRQTEKFKRMSRETMGI